MRLESESLAAKESASPATPPTPSRGVISQSITSIPLRIPTPMTRNWIIRLARGRTVSSSLVSVLATILFSKISSKSPIKRLKGKERATTQRAEITRPVTS